MSLTANQVFIGWTLLASGIIFIISYFFLGLMFSVKAFPWGPLNDLTYVLAVIFVIPFLVGIYEDLLVTHPFWALIALIIGVGGIGLITYTQVGLVRGVITFSLNLRQGAFGAGLLGIGFIINHLKVMDMGILPPGLIWLALAAGILMAMGIPAGLFFGKEELKLMTGRFDWRSANRLGVAVISAVFLGQFVLIIWVFLTGFYLI